MNKKLNGIHYFGIILMIIGLFFIIFPQFFSVFAVRFAAIVIMLISMLGVFLGLGLSSRIAVMVNIIIIFLSAYVFFNPASILAVVGLSCLLNGSSQTYHSIKETYSDNNKSLFYGIILILVGLFFVFNSQMALNSIIFFLGIFFTLAGIIIISQGKHYNASKTQGYYSSIFHFDIYNDKEKRQSHSTYASQISKHSKKDSNVEEADFEEIDRK